MNKIYKIIWSKTRNCYVVASELAKSSGKSGFSLSKKIMAALVISSLSFSYFGCSEVEAHTKSVTTQGFIGKGQVFTSEPRSSIGTSISGYQYQGNTLQLNNINFTVSTPTAGTARSSLGLTLGAYIYDEKTDGYKNINSSLYFTDTDTITTLTAADDSVKITLDEDALKNGYYKYEIKANGVHYYSVNADPEVQDNYDNKGATGDNALAAGVSAKAEGTNGVAVGTSVTAKGNQSIAVGTGATAEGNQSIAIGTGAKAEGQGSIVLGSGGARTTGQHAMAWGTDTYAGGMKTAVALNPNSGSVPRLYYFVNTADNQQVPVDKTGYQLYRRTGTAPYYGEATGDFLYQLADGTPVAKRSERTGVKYYKVSFETYSSTGREYLKYGEEVPASSLVKPTGELVVDTSVANGTVWGNRTLSSGFASTAWGGDSAATGAFATAFGTETIASGPAATAFGSQTVASGAHSVAFGGKTRAEGPGSVAWGNGTRAFGDGYSTAFGLSTSASGAGATAWGNNSIASYSYATAFGMNTKATDTAATAFGTGTEATSSYATAFGNGTKATNVGATAWGSGTLASAVDATVWGDRAKATAQDATAWGVKAYAGSFLATAWGETTQALGTRSTAFGSETVASGQMTTSFGTGTASFDSYDVSWGHASIADGPAATAFGDSTSAIGQGTTAWGAHTLAGNIKYNGEYATVTRTGTYLDETNKKYRDSYTITTQGVNGSRVWKYITVEYDQGTSPQSALMSALQKEGVSYGGVGANATAWGDSTVASYDLATAFGRKTQATADAATAFGQQTQASGAFSTAFGAKTVASDEGATAFGLGTRAVSTHATAFGQDTVAMGNDATAFGMETIANGQSATAFGNKTVAGKVTYNGTDVVLEHSADGKYSAKDMANGSKLFTFDSWEDARNGYSEYDGHKVRVSRVYDRENSKYNYNIVDRVSGEVLATFDTQNEANSAVTNYSGVSFQEAAYATAFGQNTIAGSTHATAFGQNNKALGNMATAFGQNNIAQGFVATAFGQNTRAEKEYDTAFGAGNTAKGGASTAFGQFTTASSWAATAFGQNTVAMGVASTATGQNSISYGLSSMAFGQNSVANGENSLAALGGTTGMGGQWGENADERWGSGGKASVAIGEGAVALVDYTYAIGQKASATAGNSMAFGNEANAYGAQSVAIGTKAGASNVSVAIGNEANGYANVAVAVGNKASAGSDNGIAIGNGAAASDSYDAEGNETSTYNAIAIGTSAMSSGTNATAVGTSASATAGQAVSIGTSTSASANQTVSIGTSTVASAVNAISIGTGSQVSGENSIAIGTGNKVKAKNSAAIGDPNNLDGEEDNYAYGNNNMIAVSHGYILGSESSVGLTSSVALGYQSATGETLYATPSMTVNGTKYDFAGGAPVGTVSVGAEGKERTITNVAAGRISATSTDAINGSQLYFAIQALNEKVVVESGDSSVNVDSKVEPEDAAGAGTTGSGTTSGGTTDAGNTESGTTTGGNDTTTTGGNTGATAGGDSGEIEPTRTTTYIVTANTTTAEAGSDNLTVEDSNPGGDDKTHHYTIDLAKEIHVTNVTVDNSVKVGDKTTIEGDQITTNTVNGDTINTNTINLGDTTIEEGDDNHITYKKGGNTYNIATVEDGMDYVGDDGKAIHKNLAEQLDIVGGAEDKASEYNIYTYNDGDKLRINLAKDIKGVDSVTVNKTVKVGDKTTIEGDQITTNTVNGDTINTNTINLGDTTIEEGDDNHITYKKGGNTYNIATVEDGMDYVGDDGKAIHKNLAEQLDIVGGAEDKASEYNIYTYNDDGKLRINLAKDINGVDNITVNDSVKVGDKTTIEGDKITVGDTIVEGDQITTKTVNADTFKAGDTTINNDGLTINEGPSITKNGIDAGDKKITNVARGTDDTDAVNVSQLKESSQDIYNTINRLDDSTRKGIAGAAALAALHPLDFDPDDKWEFSAGVGNYRGETAAAIGAFYHPNDDTIFSLGGTVGNGDNLVNAGVTFRFGQKNHQSRSKKAMAKEIVELRAEVAELKALVYNMASGKMPGLDLTRTEDFPDTPENHWAYDYVSVLAGNGVLEGYPDGYFKGDRTLTRYEMAAIIYRAMMKGVDVDERMAEEFAPELARVKVDTLTSHNDGTPSIQRVRVIKGRE